MNPEPPILIIVGMHRSGTSLLASWLQQCGLNIGSELSPAGVGNPLGHFENVAFLDFHRSLLNDHLDNGIEIDERIEIPPEKYAVAREIVAQERAAPQWGWKDPRTCLFLDFWKEILPDARFLCVYRHPASVADSSLRRTRQQRIEQGLRPFNNDLTSQKRYFRLRRHLNRWKHYNREILRFMQAHPDDTLLLKTEDFPVYDRSVINFLNARWGFHLKPVEYNVVYKPEMIKKGVSVFDQGVATVLSPSAMRMYTQLHRQRAKTLRRIVGL